MTLPRTTFRNALFQLHWFFGITAGIVLALVGATGAMLSFEDGILEAINPGVLSVQARGKALPPDALVARILQQRPDDAIASLTLSGDPEDVAQVGFAAKGESGGRGERRHVDPYSGALLGEARGEGFFRTTMQLHRWLVLDDIGKQIVGFSTVVLVFFCLSGLYLRWPRRLGSLRTWLALDWKQKGRNFLWHLHSIVGTWVLLTYLVMALTGLWWSYDWYRDAVDTWAGKQERAQPRQDSNRTAPALDIAAAWRAFDAAAPAWSNATLQWPKDNEAIAFRYLDANPAHERARNQLQLDRWTLAPVEHQRYDDGSWRQKIGASMFALHRGSFFGTGGVVVFMLASALMPLFAITGWMLYLDRRRKLHAARDLARAQPALVLASGNDDAGGDRLLVAFASQTGTAERLAWQTAASLREARCNVEVQSLGKLSTAQLAAATRVLFVVSTFGEGEGPDSARGIARRLRSLPPGALPSLHYGVLSLGDREYADSYCGFGRDLDHWLHHAGAQPLFDRIDVDAGDPGALRHWQHHIGQLAGRSDLPDWSAPAYRGWRLVERRHLNPGSPGGPAFHLALVPDDAADLHWQAGDIAEIGPRNPPGDVARWLTAADIDGDAVVDGDHGETLAMLLASSHLPDAAAVRGQAPQQVAANLEPLPHREYSVASLPADGSLQLLVRQMRHPDGRAGSGSGWLTGHANIGDTIALRIRSNPSFHAPADDRPLLLIGNGTGLAGLRAVLKARIQAGHHRNWLLFGERTADHDGFHRDELDNWLRDGRLQRLDLVFSRDQASIDGSRLYVQHALREHAADVRQWLADGAAVYVCGSLAGMAPAVETGLTEIVGIETLETMAADGRYRRDVY